MGWRVELGGAWDRVARTGNDLLNQSLTFRRPVGLGDTVTVRVTVREKLPEKKRLLLDCECVNQSGETVIKGEANVIAPRRKSAPATYAIA